MGDLQKGLRTGGGLEVWPVLGGRPIATDDKEITVAVMGRDTKAAGPTEMGLFARFQWGGCQIPLCQPQRSNRTTGCSAGQSWRLHHIQPLTIKIPLIFTRNPSYKYSLIALGLTS